MNLFLHKIKFILPLFLIISILVFNIYLYYTHQLNTGRIFNSDVTFLPSFYKDLVINGGAYSLWHLPAAPYLFPDVALYAIPFFITDHYYSAAVLFFTLQSILIIYALFLIYHLFFNKLLSLKLIAISFALVFVFPTPVNELLHVSVFHTGEFVSSLFSIFFILKIIKFKEVNYSYFILLIMVSALTLVSDTLYLIHFILPAIATILILLILGNLNLKKALMLISTLIISIFIAYLLYKLLIFHPNKPKIVLQLSNFSINFQKLIDMLSFSVEKYTTSSILIGIIYLISLIFILFRNKLSKTNNFTIYSFLAFFLIFMLITNISAAVFLQNSIATRYMIPAFLLPIFIAAIIINLNTNIIINKSKNIIEILALCIIGFILYNSFHSFSDSTIYKNYYPESVKCFDNFISETNTTAGASGYWLSKKYFILSKHNKVTIAQYFTNLSKYKWVTTENWYKPKYDFILIDYSAPQVHQLNKNAVIRKTGQPDKIYKCPGLDILYYKNGAGI